MNFTNENPVRTFEERFTTAKTGNISSKIEHEIVHAVRKILGYKTVDKDVHGNEKPYVLPDGTEEGFRKYVSQGPEAEEMYVVIHNDLLHCATEGENFCQSAFSLTYKMYDALKIEAKGVPQLEAAKMTKDEVIAENKLRVEKFRKFKERIVGLLNKIDVEIPEDKRLQYNWKNILRNKMVRILTDDLVITE